MSAVIPASHRDLAERPHFAVLAMIRPDDTVQANPMWFEFIDGQLRFTHTSKRQKFRNLQHNPSMSLAIMDPADPLRYLEVRGELVEAVPDPTGAFYVRLSSRYGEANPTPPPDSADRVILVMSVRSVSVR